MASTATGRRLTEQHRQSQVALRARVVRQLVGLWQGFDPDDIDVSWQRIAPFVMQIATQGRQISEGLSATYYRGFRAAEGVTGAPPSVELSPDWRARAQASFYLTGPVAAKALVKINRPDVAQQALVHLSGSLSRVVLNAGRETITETVAHDERALAWFRVTDGDPCSFCAMLASRGPVYRTRESGAFQAHDACACTAEPQFVSGAAWPGRGREFQEMWGRVTANTKGAESVRAFRRAYEGRSVADN